MDDLTQKLVIGLASGVCASIVTVLLTSVSNSKYWKRDKAHESELAIVNELLDLLRSLEEQVTKYWSVNACNLDNDSCYRPLIISRLTMIRYIIGLLFENISMTGNSMDSSLNRLYNEIYDLTTGGEFYSPNRKRSNWVILKASKLISQYRVEVLRCVYSPERFL